MEFDKICFSCKAGFHDECAFGWAGALEEGQVCCCGGGYDLADEYAQLMKDKIGALIGIVKPKKPKLEAAPAAEPEEEMIRGNSGYIDPRAWPSTQDIGTLREPTSTGRKRAKTMYPMPIGHICEWAGLAAAGGGVHPVVGCPGYPATDIHHGPDKNTLNNMRFTAGTSDGAQNCHLICSFCHNAWHAANNPDYPKRNKEERIAKQAEPWLPQGICLPHDPDTLADVDEVYRVDRERKTLYGDIRNAGRKDITHVGPNTEYIDDGELDDPDLEPAVAGGE